jgi:hypothetical protein
MKNSESYANGYYLRVRNDIYELEYGHDRYVGSLRNTVVFAVKTLGFDVNDLENAVITMHSKDHYVAYFGSYKKLIWTS